MPASHRRHSRKHKTDKEKGIFTIPELRVAFEHIEDMTADLIKKKKSDDDIQKSLIEEWQKVFYRKLDRESAKSYIEYVREEVKMGRSARKTRRSLKGGGGQDATAPAMALQGAPLNYDTRPGVYPPAGDIPPNAYGATLSYVDKGFNVAVPEPGYKHDLQILPPEKLYPTAPEESGKLGLSGGGRKARSLRISRKKGKRSLRGRTQKGGAPSWLVQPLHGAPLARVFESSAPPSVQYTAMRTFEGQPPQNLSPDPSQNNLKYLMGPNDVPIDLTVAKIPVNLKADIRVN
jgi:hypothetical protein